MNLPSQNIINRPSLDSFELFVDAVASIGDVEKRALAGVLVCSTFEQTSKTAGVPLLEIPAIVTSIAKCKPRDDLMEFEPGSKGYYFKASHTVHAEAFAEIQKFVAAFTK